MKKIFLSLLFVAGATFALSAQCNKDAAATKSACCAAKKTTSVETSTNGTMVASVVMSAEQAASSDASIQKRQCPESGAVSYYQKSMCNESGKVSWNEVQFDEKTNSFKMVASSTMEKNDDGKAIDSKSASCSKAEKTACKDKKAACCAKKADGTK